MINRQKVLDSELESAIEGLINDLGYDITHDDIDAGATNVIGIYLTDKVPENASVGDDADGYYASVTIRLHGKDEIGDRVIRDQHKAIIESRLEMSNTWLNNINIRSSVLRSSRYMGKNTKSIPIYNIAFTINYI